MTSNYVLDDNFNIKQENMIIILNVHLRQTFFSSWQKGLKDPSVPRMTFYLVTSEVTAGGRWWGVVSGTVFTPLRI